MKQFVIILSFAAGIFISCKDDDNGELPPEPELQYDERIIGSWAADHVAGQPGPTSSYGTGTETLHYENGQDITVEFKTDNTFLLTNQSRVPVYFIQGFFNSSNDTTYIAPSKNKLLSKDEFLHIVEVNDSILTIEHIGYNKNGQSGWAFIARLRLSKK
jgi:hypothetical protein